MTSISDMEPTTEDLKRILQNAKDLLKEAQLLLANGHARRAGFLAITSIEELSKVMSYEQSKQKKNLHHKEKFKLFNDEMEKVFSEAVALDFVQLAGANGESFGADQAKMVNGLWREIMFDLKKTFQLERLRQFFLYEDLIPPKEAVRFRESINSALPRFIVKAAANLHKAAKI